MIDPFVLLTPILILSVLALVRFVGCLSKPAPPAPRLTAAVPGDSMVVLTWDADQYGLYTGYNIKRGSAHGGPYATIGSAKDDETSFTDTGLTNGTELFYVISGKLDADWIFDDPSETDNSNELAATPAPNITVTFDNPTPTPNSGDPIGTYKNLNFPAEWIWVDTFQGGGDADAATFTQGNSPGGNVMFINGPRLLLSIRVFAKRPANVTISDNSLANPQVAVAIPAANAGAPFVIQTNWTQPTMSFFIGTDIGFDLLVDAIVYLGPA